jgi:hypothetical protein
MGSDLELVFVRILARQPSQWVRLAWGTASHLEMSDCANSQMAVGSLGLRLRMTESASAPGPSKTGPIMSLMSAQDLHIRATKTTYG